MNCEAYIPQHYILLVRSANSKTTMWLKFQDIFVLCELSLTYIQSSWKVSGPKTLASEMLAGPLKISQILVTLWRKHRKSCLSYHWLEKFREDFINVSQLSCFQILVIFYLMYTFTVCREFFVQKYIFLCSDSRMNSKTGKKIFKRQLSKMVNVTTMYII